MLIAHDGRGKPMCEVRIHRRHMSEQLVQRVQLWCKEQDTALALVR